MYVCRSDLHFMPWYSMQQNIVGYLISPTVDPWQIWIKVLYHLKLCVYYFLWNILLFQSHHFLFKRSFFCERIFSIEHPIWFKEFFGTIEKEYLIVRIFRSSHSQELINIKNGGTLYKIWFLFLIWKKYWGLISSEHLWSAALNIQEITAFKINFPFLTCSV